MVTGMRLRSISLVLLKLMIIDTPWRFSSRLGSRSISRPWIGNLCLSTTTRIKCFHIANQSHLLLLLSRHDRPKAVDILVKDLKVFSTFNEELFKEITQLLTLENFRENEQLSKYGDTKSARAIMLVELKKLIEANPLFRDKLQFPTLRTSRLRTLINQRYSLSFLVHFNKFSSCQLL